MFRRHLQPRRPGERLVNPSRQPAFGVRAGEKMVREQTYASGPQQPGELKCDLLQRGIAQRWRQVVERVGQHKKVEPAVERGRQGEHVALLETELRHVAVRCPGVRHGGRGNIDANHLVGVGRKASCHQA